MAESQRSLTYFFTDLESSTRLWERHPEAMAGALARHDQILHEAVEAQGGSVIKTTGDGLMGVFEQPADAVAAGVLAQTALAGAAWPETGPLKVRIGMHSGPATPRDGDYFGPAVNRAARIMAAAHGGQVLVSGRVADEAAATLDTDLHLRDLGSHRLKDLAGPVRLLQIEAAGLATSFPPLNTLDARPNNLPSQVSAFFGRDAELATLRDLLDAQHIRLVTLTGPGGTGKTRLALQAAADQIDRFSDGVCFVDLAPTTETDQALLAIALATDADLGSDEPVLDSLRRHLADRHLLLVLDNFEQVTDAAPAVGDLIRSCPSIEALVTSREALRLDGERIVEVPPLSVPRDDKGGATYVAGSEAVELFVDRAIAQDASFALDDANAASVAGIVTRLDGLPLAIELAVARLRLFSPSELEARLTSRFVDLKGGSRDLPDRQQTLHSTIAWSADLLDPDDRSVFTLLSVFSGATIRAVEGVAQLLSDMERVDTIGSLESLIDKSLVRRRGNGAISRLGMLETIRAFAADDLAEDADRAGAVRRAHATYFAEHAAAQSDQLTGAARSSTLAALTADIENLEQAWRYWLDRSDRERLNQLLDALWTIYDARGWYQRVIDLATDLLEVLATESPSQDRMREEIAIQTSVARATMAIAGYTPEVEERFNRAIALAEEAGGPTEQLFPVLRSLASLYVLRTEHEKGTDIGRRLVELASKEEDPALKVEAHFILGSNLVLLNQFDEGMAHLEIAIDLFDPVQTGTGRFRLGPNAGVVAMTTAAFTLWWRGFPEQALMLSERALASARALEHPTSEAYALYHSGLLHMWRQDVGSLEECARALLDVATANDYPIWRSLATVQLGICEIATGNAETGLETVESGVAVYKTLKTPPAFISGLFSQRAAAYLMAGQPAVTVETLGFLINDDLGLVETPLGALGLVLYGDALAASSTTDPSPVEMYSRGLAIAQRRDVLLVEIIAATRMAYVTRGTADGEQAVRHLAALLERMTEGDAEVDIVAAHRVVAGGPLFA